jgi:Type I phosphodiesterase / nucleotide pyrophosphatase
MRRVLKLGVAAAIAAGAVGGSAAAVSAHSDNRGHRHRGRRISHVLLISVDGMHQSDLDWYVANHPGSALAQLASGGTEFKNNHTSDPSDSDPGGTAIMTGGDPRATGVYYDVEYSHGVFPPGTTNCSGPVPGGNVIYDSPDDTLPAVPDFLHPNPSDPAYQTFPSFDEGGSIYPGTPSTFPGYDNDPGAIMKLIANPKSDLNPATFPVDPKTCQADHALGLPEGQLDLPGHQERGYAHRVV